MGFMHRPFGRFIFQQKAFDLASINIVTGVDLRPPDKSV